MTAFWDVWPRILVENYRRFRGDNDDEGSKQHLADSHFHKIRVTC